MNKILLGHRSWGYSQETIDNVHAAAKRLGYDLSTLKYRQRRKHPRQPVRYQATVSLDPGLKKKGLRFEALVTDLSEGGVRLGDSGLPFPLGLTVKIQEGPLKGTVLRGKLAHLKSGDPLIMSMALTIPNERMSKILRKLSEKDTKSD